MIRKKKPYTAGQITDMGLTEFVLIFSVMESAGLLTERSGNLKITDSGPEPKYMKHIEQE